MSLKCFLKLGIITVLLLWGASFPCRANARNVESIEALADSLERMTDFRKVVKLEISLPMAAQDEIDYTIYAASLPTEEDTLSVISYLMEWRLQAADKEVKGFTSYFPGNFYRFRDGQKIQEYHADNNSSPFLSQSPVQTTAQFLEVFPVTLGRQLHEMAKDSTYTLTFTPDTVYRGRPAVAVKGNRVVRGLDALEFTYVFDKASLEPIILEKELSPGSISEQTLEYEYTDANISDFTVPLSEAELVGRYPEPFTLFREGSYGLNSLKGRRMPSFALPDLDGRRYQYERGTALSNPAVVVFLDENVATTPVLIKDIRSAVNALPKAADVFFIFLSNRRDEVADLFGTIEPGEKVLTSGRNAVKDFGVAETPSMLFVNSDGTVSDVLVGFNKQAEEIVIQKMVLTK